MRKLLTVVNIGTYLLFGVGFFGLWAAKVYREHVGLSEKDYMMTNGKYFVWSFAVAFIVGALVLFPTVLYLRTKVGQPVGGPNVPGWIAIPVRVVMVIGFLNLLVLFVLTRCVSASR